VPFGTNSCLLLPTVVDSFAEVPQMAVYEFECRDCGRHFDVTVPMQEHARLKEQPPPCPDCQSSETRQLVSLFHCKSPKGF
jgi:putative FmdB family regulatory protein